MLRLRFVVAPSGNAAGRFVTRPSLRYFSGLRTDLDRWQRRCDRLTQLQRRIHFPPLEVIAVDGKDVKLPLPAVEAARSPCQEELEYLVGFFDGDGCVSMNRATGEVQLVIGQSVDSAEVLLRFRSFLGGSVSRHSASTGSRKAAVRWQVSGSLMIAAAETLIRVPSMKRAQLLVATQGTVPKNDRERVAHNMLMFKKRQYLTDRWASSLWPYFAGFFDAEGSIIVRPTQPGLRLAVWQVSPCILEHLLRFLHENELQSWTLRPSGFGSTLVCDRLPDINQTLELLLAHGLLVKRKQAQLALSLTAETHLEIRDAISSLHGFQGRYQRLDTDGITRAREIGKVAKETTQHLWTGACLFALPA